MKLGATGNGSDLTPGVVMHPSASMYVQSNRPPGSTPAGLSPAGANSGQH